MLGDLCGRDIDRAGNDGSGGHLGGRELAADVSRRGIACCESTNWDRAATYADGLLANPTTRGHLGLVTGHAYWSAPSGSIDANPITSAAHASKHTWETEISDFTTNNPKWAGETQRPPATSGR